LPRGCMHVCSDAPIRDILALKQKISWSFRRARHPRVRVGIEMLAVATWSHPGGAQTNACLPSHTTLVSSQPSLLRGAWPQPARQAQGTSGYLGQLIEPTGPASVTVDNSRGCAADRPRNCAAVRNLVPTYRRASRLRSARNVRG
jgi:hypothetical protein